MREALNSNPVVQAAVIGVLAIGGGLMLLTTMSGGKKSNEASTAGATAGSTPSVTATATPSPGASTVAPTAPAPAPATVAPPKAGPGLPQAVMNAYTSGKTVVLLITRSGGIDDKLVRQSTSELSGNGKVTLFVTDATGIARYSRLTEGVGVSQVPALVVVSPKSAKGGAPVATVSYGFRGGASVAQAVRDAEYKGPSVGYDPG